MPLAHSAFVFLHPQPEVPSVSDPPDVLDRQKCLAALASLRHAKWFQVCELSSVLCLTVSEFCLGCRQAGSGWPCCVRYPSRVCWPRTLGPAVWRNVCLLFAVGPGSFRELPWPQVCFPVGQSQRAEVLCHCHPGPEGLVYPCAHLGSSQRMGKAKWRGGSGPGR